jgi:alkanesulfonate monooxygenase SsuD/methylene tetrahydromethanopterin reductase-like flavin-dependent oxidoreductase (luciferase family)
MCQGLSLCHANESRAEQTRREQSCDVCSYRRRLNGHRRIADESILFSAGWRPTRDDILYRAAVCATKTEEKAQQDAARCVLKNLNMTMRGDISEAVARLDPTGLNIAKIGEFSMARFVGTPDMIVQQVKECKEHNGAGVIDVGFHVPGMTHDEITSRLELFGTQVLPRVRDI